MDKFLCMLNFVHSYILDKLTLFPYTFTTYKKTMDAFFARRLVFPRKSVAVSEHKKNPFHCRVYTL